ncbi:hypothetical protein D9M68_869980 [compost metagenome]
MGACLRSTRVIQLIRASATSAMLCDELSGSPMGFKAFIAAISALLPSRFSTRLKL